MIKANELRIGNWVDLYDSQTGSSFVKVNASLISLTGFVNPIPLTPEILEKCGLRDPAGNGWGYRMDIGHSMEFCYYVQDGFMRYQTKGSGFSLNFSERIKYLHQFQNLFLDFTGEELQIQL